MKKFHLLILLVCLGIFVFPKNTFTVEKEKSSCCKKSESKSKDCCKKETDLSSCTKESKKDSGCEDNCTDCKICCYSLVLSLLPINYHDDLQFDLNYSSIIFPYKNQKPKFLYFNIWQPPKIV